MQIPLSDIEIAPKPKMGQNIKHCTKPCLIPVECRALDCYDARPLKPMLSIRKISDRSLFLILAVGTLAIDVGGFGLQTVLKLNPCPLCIFQRVLFLMLFLWGLLGAALPFRILIKPIGVCILLTSLVGAATAGYQSWMQLFPENFTNTCNNIEPNLIEQFVDWLGMIEPTLFMASGLCTSKAWEFLHLSMANWALSTFTLIALLSIWRLRTR
jgi:protein dithiol:quinone oxidoreductase